MITNKQAFAELNTTAYPCQYNGYRQEWFQVISQYNDSKVLERSNFRSALRILRLISFTEVAVERARHWVREWQDVICIHPDNKELLLKAERIVLSHCVDPIDYHALLDEEAEKLWNSYSGKKRMELVKDFGGKAEIRYCKMSFWKLESTNPQVYNYLRSSL